MKTDITGVGHIVAHPLQWLGQRDRDLAWRLGMVVVAPVQAAAKLRLS